MTVAIKIDEERAKAAPELRVDHRLEKVEFLRTALTHLLRHDRFKEMRPQASKMFFTRVDVELAVKKYDNAVISAQEVLTYYRGLVAYQDLMKLETTYRKFRLSLPEIERDQIGREIERLKQVYREGKILDLLQQIHPIYKQLQTVIGAYFEAKERAVIEAEEMRKNKKSRQLENRRKRADDNRNRAKGGTK